MAYDELLADRVRNCFDSRGISFTEKKMMGGLSFMVNEKMCVGVHEERLMARIDPDVYEHVLTKEGCTKMEFTGREMKGFVFIYPDGTDADVQLEYWVDLALDFNPRAKSSKKKKKKP